MAVSDVLAQADEVPPGGRGGAHDDDGPDDHNGPCRVCNDHPPATGMLVLPQETMSSMFWASAPPRLPAEVAAVATSTPVQLVQDSHQLKDAARASNGLVHLVTTNLLWEVARSVGAYVIQPQCAEPVQAGPRQQDAPLAAKATQLEQFDAVTKPPPVHDHRELQRLERPRPPPARKQLKPLPLWKMKEAAQPVDLSNITVDGLGKMELKRAISQHRGERQNFYFTWLTHEKEIETNPDAPRHVHELNSMAYDNAVRLDKIMDELEDQLATLCENKDKFKQRVVIPEDTGTDQRINYREAKQTIPEFDHTHKTLTVKGYFEKLFGWGTKRNLSHNNYMELLQQSLQGEMYDLFSTCVSRELTHVVRRLEDEFLVGETLHDYKQKLTDFVRKPKEPIRACVSRYRRILEKTQTRLAPERAIERTLAKLEHLLFTVASPTAKVKLAEAERHSELNGYDLEWKTMLKIVEEQEDVARDIPGQATPITVGIRAIKTRNRKGPSTRTHNYGSNRLRSNSLDRRDRSLSPGQASMTSAGTYAGNEPRDKDQDPNNPVRDKRPRLDDGTAKEKQFTPGFSNPEDVDMTQDPRNDNRSRRQRKRRDDRDRTDKRSSSMPNDERPYLHATRRNSPSQDRSDNRGQDRNPPPADQRRGDSGTSGQQQPQGGYQNIRDDRDQRDNRDFRGQSFRGGRGGRSNAPFRAYHPSQMNMADPSIWPMVFANMLPQGAITSAIFPGLMNPKGSFPTNALHATRNQLDRDFRRGPYVERGLPDKSNRVLGQCWTCGSKEPNHDYTLCRQNNVDPKTQNRCPECGSTHRHPWATCARDMRAAKRENLKK
ncbi:unnamed protein product [Sphagnum tenellum]